MKNFLRNFVGLLGGVTLGAAVNGGIIALQPYLLSLPQGVDPNNIDSLMKAIGDFQWHHFVMPFVAHALGTFSGAYFAVRVTRQRPLFKAMAISVIFLLGGIQMVQLLPAPLWFEIVDLTLAYLPMGGLAYYIGVHHNPTRAAQ